MFLIIECYKNTYLVRRGREYEKACISISNVNSDDCIRVDSNDGGSASDTSNTTTGDNSASADNAATGDNSASADTSADNSAATDNSASGEQTMDYGSGEIKIWVPDAVTGVTQTLCDSFFEAHPEMNGYTVAIEPMGEGDAAGNVITDVEAAPDLYAFAQDQMARLVTAGALTPINGDYAT